MTPEPNYILRTTRIHVVEEGKSIHEGGATVVEIVDGGGGEFINIVQTIGHNDLGGVSINNEAEWNAISAAVQDLFADIKRHDSRLPREEGE